MERKKRAINLDCYDTLGDRWYTAQDDPIALLRAESQLRNPWIATKIDHILGHKGRILDIGCGGGFISNYLAQQGHQVTGIDLSPESLKVAHKYDTTQTVTYQVGDAYQPSFSENSFDAVCAMDFLEHVERPDAIITNVSRLLKPGGLFFFHTFNRTFFSWLLAIKGLEWFVKNTPPQMHVYSLFIKPKELIALCAQNQLIIQELRGMAPKIWAKSFWKMLVTRVVPDNFQFEFTPSLLTGYIGYAQKNSATEK